VLRYCKCIVLKYLGLHRSNTDLSQMVGEICGNLTDLFIWVSMEEGSDLDIGDGPGELKMNI